MHERLKRYELGASQVDIELQPRTANLDVHPRRHSFVERNGADSPANLDPPVLDAVEKARPLRRIYVAAINRSCRLCCPRRQHLHFHERRYDPVTILSDVYQDAAQLNEKLRSACAACM
jgi:hypothetical protein